MKVQLGRSAPELRIDNASTILINERVFVIDGEHFKCDTHRVSPLREFLKSIKEWDRCGKWCLPVSVASLRHNGCAAIIKCNYYQITNNPIDFMSMTMPAFAVATPHQ